APASPFRVVPLRGNVYVLYGRGGNVGFLVGPKSVLMVDAEFRDVAPGIAAEVAKVSPLPIEFLVNTHHHNDHVGGNEYFASRTRILAHENVRRHMLAEPAEILAEAPSFGDSLRRLLAAAPDSAERGRLERTLKRLDDQVAWARSVKMEDLAPTLTLVGNGELRVHLGAETVRLLHVGPAHTDGDCAVFFEQAHVVHMGDLYFHRVIPYIDWEHGASVPGYIAFLDTVLSQAPADAQFIPGHGEVSGADGLKEFRQYLSDLADAVRAEHAAGHTREQAMASLRLPKYADWSGYADRFKVNVEAAWRTIFP
ncbi:MAG TPA: MBL fold metallo-hydrolase, partial [Candidatus Saccharimonadales bacterium]|nr:MBL fold metallo-hydrolase [Candidatus Saccharimonadales bacterium]